MFLKDTKSGDLVEVVDVAALVNPFVDRVKGRFHAGEELQDPADFSKNSLIFPSGEPLPKCWRDSDYER